MNMEAQIVDELRKIREALEKIAEAPRMLGKGVVYYSGADRAAAAIGSTLGKIARTQAPDRPMK